MNNDKQQWHFGKWDFFVFLTTILCFVRAIKYIAGATQAYFESKKETIINIRNEYETK